MTKSQKEDGFLSLFLKGSAIGVGNAIAGISGGTVAVICGVYGDMLHSLANLTNDFKKNIWFLIKIFLGVAFGLVGSFALFRILFDNIMLEMVSLFSGVIIGGIVNDKNDYHIKKETPKKKYIISFVLAFLVVLSLTFVNFFLFEEGTNDNFNTWTNVRWDQSLLLFVAIIFGATCMIFPGISGSLCFMILGIYNPVKNQLVELFDFSNYSNPQFIIDSLMIVVPLLVGALLALLFISKPINKLYEKHKDIFSYIVLGFLLASIISMYILNIDAIIYQFSVKWGSFGFLHLFLAFLIFLPGGYLLATSMHKRKLKLEKEGQN